MRSVALLITPLLTFLLCSGPALAGQRSSQVVIVNNFASRPALVVPQSRVVGVGRPFLVRPFVGRPGLVDRQVLVVRPTGVGSPSIAGKTFAPQSQVLVFHVLEQPH